MEEKGAELSILEKRYTTCAKLSWRHFAQIGFGVIIFIGSREADILGKAGVLDIESKASFATTENDVVGELFVEEVE